MKRYVLQLCLFILFSSVFPSNAKAQHNLGDSVRTAYKKGYKFTGGLTGRRSLFVGQPVRQFQLFAGMDYQKVFKVYWGFNFMPEGVTQRKIVNPFTSFADTTDLNSRVHYLSMTFEYAFYRKDRWKISVPMAIGVGGNTVNSFNTVGELESTETSFILPLETGIHALYYLKPWIGVKSGLGLRIVASKTNYAILSGPYYQIGIAVFPKELYRAVFKKD